MKKLILLFFLFTFILIGGNSFAETSPDGCATWSSACVSGDIVGSFSWSPFIQADVNEVRSDCTLSSATYTITIIGLGDRSAGSNTTYSWSGLSPETTYQWKVTSSYSCTDPTKYGSIPTDTYSLTTTRCGNQPPNPPNPNPPPSGVTWENCTFQGKSIPVFGWTYSDPDGDPQAAYEIWIDTNSSYSDPKFNHIVNVAATSYALDLTQDDENPDNLPSSMQDYELNWDTEYHWKVRVKDSYDAWSNFSSSHSFRTPDHAYPYPGFSWLPQEPTQKEVVVFDPVEAGADEYRWTVNEYTGTGYSFVDGTDIFDEEPHIKFLTSDNIVKLEVTDDDGYSCESEEQDLTAQLPLPEYKEVAPIIWFKNLFSEMASLLDGFTKIFDNG